jgi:redox-sensitive bicupin YhaK (pirin superfamily)
MDNSMPFKQLIRPRQRDLGELTVKRVLPAALQQAVGPFIFFDHMGPVEFAAGSGPNVRPHPHIGLATLTYLFEGEILHRDNTGSVQIIRPNDVNWMVAGSGIVHSERTPAALQHNTWRLHGIQTWLALPQQYEDTSPRFLHYPAATLPIMTAAGQQIRIIAGQLHNVSSPVEVFSHTLYADARLAAHHTFTLQNEHEERAIYVMQGEILVEGEEIACHTLGVLKGNTPITITARTDAHFLLLGGDKLDKKRYIWWNFVASTPDKIEAAKEKWANFAYPAIPGETEFIPLPEQ